MKNLSALLFVFILVSICGSAEGRGGGGGKSGGGSNKGSRPVNVHGYNKKDGTHVDPHRRTAPDRKKDNNWSQKGNTNPDTSKEGTKSN